MLQDTIAPPPNQALSPPPPADGANVRQAERAASVVAGGALALYGLDDVSDRLPVLLLGGFLLYRGISGHCPFYEAMGINTQAAARPVHVEHTITIAAEPSEVYRLWRDFRNLPSFMRHLEEVQVLDETRSHWVARGPAGTRVASDAEIFLERENELIAWRSTPDSQVSNAGSVRFTPAPGDRGTEVKVVLEYLPPAGALGKAAARLLGEEPGQQVSDALRRLKMIVEAGRWR